MNFDWNAIGAGGEILGGIAVLATLIYLARELKHTQSSSHLTSEERLIRAFDDGNRLLVEDANLREVLFKQEPLTDPERLQLYAFAVMKCNAWVSAQNSYDQGQISADIYASASKDVRLVANDWPALLDSFRTWLDRYPEISGYAIFDALREATRS
jgi:hypothetical protein